MSIKEIIRKYELLISESAVSEEEEERLLMLLDYIEDLLRYLEDEIERTRRVARYN